MKLKRLGIFWLPSAWLEDGWLTSRTVATLFFLSAICVIVAVPIFLGRVDFTNMSFWRRLPWGIFGILGPFGIGFIWFGMWRYWVRLDNSNVKVKRAWFVALLVGFWYASCLYYFFVYIPQVVRKRRAVGV